MIEMVAPPSTAAQTMMVHPLEPMDPVCAFWLHPPRTIRHNQTRRVRLSDRFTSTLRRKFLTRSEDASKSPFHKGGSRGICRWAFYSKSPLPPFGKGGNGILALRVTYFHRAVLAQKNSSISTTQFASTVSSGSVVNNHRGRTQGEKRRCKKKSLS